MLDDATLYPVGPVADRGVQEIDVPFCPTFDIDRTIERWPDTAGESRRRLADSVIFTPTLVTQGLGPRTAIIGNLEDQEILLDLLEANGVDRRRWDD